MGPKQELGYLVFFDPKLAGDPSLACSDCHDPKQGWSFADATSKGYPGSVHFRASQSVVNSGYLNYLFWQATATSLEAQAPQAAGGAQSGNGSRDVMETRLRFSPEYVKRFKEVYGTEWPLIRDAWRSMAAFERWLSQTNTPFDRYLKGEEDAISAKAKKGLDLFVGKANCIECHNGPMLVDQKFYNIGVPQPAEYLESGMHQTGLRFRSINKGVDEKLYRALNDDLIYYFNTKRKQDMGKSRSAPLRYIEFTAPYFHNGAAYTLEEVIDFYDRGGDDNQWSKPNAFNPCGTKTKILKPLNLTDDEKEALVEFLLTLDDGEIELPVPEVPNYAPMIDNMPSKSRVAEDMLKWEQAAQ
jgi:cytochrome c peroxidase